jgi:hypothetical protein
MFTIADDLVVYGGDKSGLAVCTMAGADWKWAAPAIAGEYIQHRKCSALTSTCLDMVAAGNQSMRKDSSLHQQKFFSQSSVFATTS